VRTAQARWYRRSDTPLNLAAACDTTFIMNSKLRSFPSLGLLCFVGISVQADTVSFDHYVSEQDNDLANRFHLSGNYVASPGGGITGGSVGVGDGTGVATYQRALENGRGSQLSTSIFFKYASSMEPQLPGVSPGEGITTRLGFALNGDQGVIFFQPDYAVFAELGSHFGGSQSFFGIYVQVLDSQMLTVAGTSDSGQLIDGNWYRMNLAVRNTQSGVYEASARLEDYGKTGEALSSVVGSVSGQMGGSLENGLLFGGQDLHAGWAGYRHVSQFDNFSATSVPEPGVLALVALGGLGIGFTHFSTQRSQRSQRRKR